MRLARSHGPVNGGQVSTTDQESEEGLRQLAGDRLTPGGPRLRVRLPEKCQNSP